ncbi:MAG: ribosome small subunit-dependent GTPase A [Pseudohongiellaceae bacterium]
MSNFTSLASLGWQPFFQQQLSLEELNETTPARIIEQHKSEISVATGTNVFSVALLPSMPNLVVGDWILLDGQLNYVRLLDRKTVFSRKAAGSKLEEQLLSANVDTAFIVCSINKDFNLNRIERLLSLVNKSQVEAVVVLSKSDQSDSPESFVKQVQNLDPFLFVEAVNCLDKESVATLSPWLKSGSTVAVLGSSGVGKSTLTNTLLGDEKQSTGSIREDDSKGRHTTTKRSLVALDSGGLILDTPGMRELQLADAKDGIAATFSDIEGFATRCRYRDCQHESEPGCAVREAVESGVLEQRRLDNYQKLLREVTFNSASLSEKKANDKTLGKFYKRSQSDAKKLKGR